MQQTPLCQLFKKYGSDKVINGRTDRVCHNYSPFYYELFEPRKDSINSLLEVGIGRAPDRSPGPSLKAWRDFFVQAQVYGADINAKLMFEDARVKTFVCNQLNGGSLALLKMGISPMNQGRVDVIIEDGIHTLDGNLITLAHLWGTLAPGGIYIIEDVKPGSVDTLMSFCKSFGRTELREFGSKYDDNLIIIWKE